MTMTKRDDNRTTFLETAGWGGADASALAGDASTRRYERLDKNGERAVLMIAPPSAEEPACPVDATPTERRTLGYNAAARLAGPNLHAFVAIARALRKAGLSAPEVFAYDAAAGLALIEDLGDDLFARVVTPQSETLLYASAIDALNSLHATSPAPAASERYQMLDYDAEAMMAEIALLSEWYWPHRTHAKTSQTTIDEYLAIWKALLGSLSAPHTFVLRDFHSENLLWLPDRTGVARVGVIDFQDALFGHRAYDVISLLEDARRDVDPVLAAQMLERYIKNAATDADFDEERFRCDAAILAAQRNAKILGIFARLANRDGKSRYLDLLPRVEAHFRRDLAKPILSPLKTFFEKTLPDLTS